MNDQGFKVHLVALLNVKDDNIVEIPEEPHPNPPQCEGERKSPTPGEDLGVVLLPVIPGILQMRSRLLGTQNDNITAINAGKGRLFKRWYSFTRQLKHLNFSQNIKVIIACDLYSLPAATAIKKRTRAKLIYDSREFYFALGPIAGQSFKQKIITSIEKHYEKNVDDMIVSSEMDKTIILNHFKHDKPYTVIMNLPPKRKFIESDKIRQKFNVSSDKKIIVYQGMALPHRGIIPLINAIKHDPRFVFVILGDGEFLPVIKALVNRENLNSKIFFTGKIPYNELHEWTCSADIGTSLFEPASLSYQYALPNKIFEYMMSHLPSIATNLPAIADLHRKTDCFELVESQLLPEQIQQSLEKLLDADVYMNYRENCAKFSEIYNYDNQKKMIIEYFGKFI